MEVKEIQLKDLPEDLEDEKDVFKHHSHFYVPQTIAIELISHRPNDLLVGYFVIDKIYKLGARNIY